MKIEANISSIEVRLNQKNQKLVLQIIKIDNKHSTRLKTFRNFFIEYESFELLEFFEFFGFSEFFEFSELSKSSEFINALKNKNSDQFKN